MGEEGFIGERKIMMRKVKGRESVIVHQSWWNKERVQYRQPGRNRTLETLSTDRDSSSECIEN
jgi:hypothetical protein